MESHNNAVVDKDQVKLDEWTAILSHPEFNHTIREYVSKRIESLLKSAESINAQKKNLDGSIELGHQYSKIEELKMLLFHFDKKLKEIRNREMAV